MAADGRWLALLGWQCGAFKVKARDAWIGWAPEQQFRRLRLVANNTRFLILPEARTPNLASRALSLSARRLSSDMEAALGHPALLAETFVDPSRFEGTCYRAANWIELAVGAERAEWDRLMDAHHYLGFRCLCSRVLRPASRRSPSDSITAAALPTSARPRVTIRRPPALWSSATASQWFSAVSVPPARRFPDAPSRR